jgi:predicted transcriptional regulator
MRVLLSINPEHANKIFAGTKKFEFRKAVPKNPVTTVVVYSTMPVGKVIGEFQIGEILSANPEKLWRKTKSASGISKKFFSSYFENRSRAFAISVCDPLLYEHPVDLSDLIGSSPPPQSFRYLEAA